MFMSDSNLREMQKTGAGAEETLRLIARIAVPEGLEDRVHARLLAEPRQARILAWPGSSGWMRSAAAAAIVFVVAGGGWRIYSRVQPGMPGRPIVVSPHVGAGGAFSEAGVVRRPLTLQGPVVKHTAANEKPKLAAKSTTPPSASPSLIVSKKSAAALASAPAQ
jgi:hypothetical protein